MPGIAEILHKQRIALTRARIAFLLDCNIAPCAYDVGDVNEVVTAKPVESDLGLLALVSVMHGNDSSRGFIDGVDSGRRVGLDYDAQVMIPSMNFEFLVVT